MAQAQLDVVQFCLNTNAIHGVRFYPKKREVTCLISETVSVVVKRTENSTSVVLREGKKCFRLSPNNFDSLCNFQQSVQFLVSFIEGNFSFYD